MVDQKEIEHIKHLRAGNNTCNANVDYLIWAIGELQARLKEVTTERDALLKEVAASEGYQAGLVSKGE